MIINSIERALPLSTWLFTLVWFSLSAIPFILFLKEQEFVLLAIFWVWIAIGAICLAYDLLKLREWLRYGSVKLMLNGPPEIGGKLDGHLIFTKNVTPDMSFSIALDCYRLQGVRESRASLVQGHSIATVTDKGIPRQETPDILVLDIQLTIPKSGMPTHMPRFHFYRRYEMYYKWYLNVKAEREGIDFNRSYPIKVS